MVLEFGQTISRKSPFTGTHTPVQYVTFIYYNLFVLIVAVTVTVSCNNVMQKECENKIHTLYMHMWLYMWL